MHMPRREPRAPSDWVRGYLAPVKHLFDPFADAQADRAPDSVAAQQWAGDAVSGP